MGIKPFFSSLLDAELAEHLHLKERVSLDDALDLHEVLVSRIENDWRAHEAAERKGREKR